MVNNILKMLFKGGAHMKKWMQKRINHLKTSKTVHISGPTVHTVFSHHCY